MRVEFIFGLKFIIIKSRCTKFEEISVINLLCRLIQSTGDLLEVVFSMKWKMQRKRAICICEVIITVGRWQQTVKASFLLSSKK